MDARHKAGHDDDCHRKRVIWSTLFDHCLLKQRPGIIRPSARADVSVHDRDVGALLYYGMGVWLATSFIGYIGSFWSRLPKPEFFLLVAGVAALAGVMIFGAAVGW